MAVFYVNKCGIILRFWPVSKWVSDYCYQAWSLTQFFVFFRKGPRKLLDAPLHKSWCCVCKNFYEIWIWVSDCRPSDYVFWGLFWHLISSQLVVSRSLSRSLRPGCLPRCWWILPRPQKTRREGSGYYLKPRWDWRNHLDLPDHLKCVVIIID